MKHGEDEIAVNITPIPFTPVVFSNVWVMFLFVFSIAIAVMFAIITLYMIGFYV